MRGFQGGCKLIFLPLLLLDGTPHTALLLVQPEAPGSAGGATATPGAGGPAAAAVG